MCSKPGRDAHALRLVRRQPDSSPRTRRGRPRAEARRDCRSPHRPRRGSTATGWTRAPRPGPEDRARLSVMLYSFARVSAVAEMPAAGLLAQGGWLRPHEKGVPPARCPGPPTGRRRPSTSTSRQAGARGAEKAALFQSVDQAGQRLAGRALTRRAVPGDDQAAHRRRRAAAVDVLQHVPGDGDHGLTSRTGEPRPRAADRGTRVAEDTHATAQPYAPMAARPPTCPFSSTWFGGRDYPAGEAVAEYLREHFTADRYSTITGGTGVPVLFNSAVDPQANTAMRVDMTSADATAVVILVDRAFARDATWTEYISLHYSRRSRFDRQRA